MNTDNILQQIFYLFIDNTTTRGIIDIIILYTLPIKRKISNTRLLTEMKNTQLKTIYGPLTKIHNDYYKSLANSNYSKNIITLEYIPQFVSFYRANMIFKPYTNQSLKFLHDNYEAYTTFFQKMI